MNLPEKPIRLNKYIAASGLCSRRNADEFIKKGLITVNDQVIREVGTKVNPSDKVKFKDKKLHPDKFVYILLNKPKDYITTTSDTHGRKIVLDLLSDELRERVYPVGRLDRNSSGLLLLTNDGDMAKKLTHPSFKVPKIYAVTLDNVIDQETIDKISRGVTLEDGYIKPDKIQLTEEKSGKQIGIEIHSGRNRIIRRLMESFGFKVSSLDRVTIGPLTKKDLPRGKWRILKEQEIRLLSNAVNRAKDVNKPRQ